MLNGIFNCRIFICTQATDMRKSFYTLSGLVRQAMNLDPMNGALFVFKNKSSNSLKILYFDGDGFAIWYKKLAKGTFKFPDLEKHECAGIEIDATTLRLILDGIDLINIRKRIRCIVENNIESVV